MLSAFPPPLAAELGFTRVRPVLIGRSRIYPTSAGGIGRGHATTTIGSAQRFMCTRSPPPPLAGEGQTEFATRPYSAPHEHALGGVLLDQLLAGWLRPQGRTGARGRIAPAGAVGFDGRVAQARSVLA